MKNKLTKQVHYCCSCSRNYVKIKHLQSLIKEL